MALTPLQMNSDKQQLIIDKTSEFVKATLQNAEGGHDWFHIYRVWKNALTLAKQESADLFVVQLAALLHDIADAKFHNGDDSIGPAVAGTFLTQQEVDNEVIIHSAKPLRIGDFINVRITKAYDYDLEGEPTEDK